MELIQVQQLSASALTCNRPPATFKREETSGKCYRLGLRHAKGKMTLVRFIKVYQRIETRVATLLGVLDVSQRKETRFGLAAVHEYEPLGAC